MPSVEAASTTVSFRGWVLEIGLPATLSACLRVFGERALSARTCEKYCRTSHCEDQASARSPQLSLTDQSGWRFDRQYRLHHKTLATSPEPKKVLSRKKV